MIKIIASDLDGTLLLHGANQLNPEIFDIIRKLKKHGIVFVSASGRPLKSQRTVWGPIADEICYIGVNGGLCCYDKQPVAISYLERDLAFRIIDEVLKNPNHRVMIDCPQNTYILESAVEFGEFILDFLKFKAVTVKSFEDIKEPILKVGFQNLNGWEASFEDIRSKFQSEVAVVSSGNAWIDLMPLDCNKGAALKYLLEQFHLSPSEAIAFGDQLNDLEMLCLVEHGYAMVTGAPEPKAKAKYLTDSVEKTLLDLLKKLENDN